MISVFVLSGILENKYLLLTHMAYFVVGFQLTGLVKNKFYGSGESTE